MHTSAYKPVILGIPVDNLNMDGALNRIWDMIEKFKTDRRNRLVATANVDFLVNAHKKGEAQKSESLLKVLRNADMVTADGMPLVWLSQLMGQPLPERVTGADMVPALAEKAARDGKSIYFFGGVDGAAKETAEILSERNPGLKVAGYTAPMIDMDDEIENMIEIARINITDPDILLIALGNPKQELWFNRYQKYLRVPVSIGIGGTFEFISGKTNRAPVWLQKTGFEWIYRMVQDPRRLIKRYFVGLVSFNLMTMPLLIMNSLLKPLGRKSIQRDNTEYTQMDNVHGDESLLMKCVYDLTGVVLNRDGGNMKNVLQLDFANVRALSTNDIVSLMNALLLAEKMKYLMIVSNLRLIPRFQLKAYRMDDLIYHADNMDLAKLNLQLQAAA